MMDRDTTGGKGTTNHGPSFYSQLTNRDMRGRPAWVCVLINPDPETKRHLWYM